jgi:hypothetical protein
MQGRELSGWNDYLGESNDFTSHHLQKKAKVVLELQIDGAGNR